MNSLTSCMANKTPSGDKLGFGKSITWALKPDGFQFCWVNGEEGRNDGGIELDSAVFLNFVASCFVRTAVTGATIGSYSVEGVDHRKDSGADMDLFAAKLAGVSATVP